MPSLFRPSYTVRDPETGERVRRKASKWYGQFVDGQGITRRLPLARDKAAARMMLNELVKRAELERAGIVDPFRDHRRRPLATHLDAFEAALRDKGTSDEHARLVATRARKVVQGCGFAFIDDVSASRVQGFIADLGRSGLSVQTQNFYLGAVKQFCRWLVKDRRAAESRVAHLSGGNVELDRRHDRRALTEDEFARLLEAARRGTPFRGIPGPDRSVLYTIASYTGLRAKELASLTPQSFDFGPDGPSVTVTAAYSKHRRQDVVPLHRGLVGPLKDWLAGKPPGERLWPGRWARDKEAGVILRRDLEAAGIPWQDADGLFADFHSLRHTYITNLVRAGVPPKVAQALARHSTITLTMDRYAHVELHDRAAALERLPGPPSPATIRGEVAALRATGTDDARPAASCTNLAQAPDAECDPVTTPETIGTAEGEDVAGHDGRRKSPDDGTCDGMIKPESGLQRRRWDSNPRYREPGTPVFETGPFNHSGTPPNIMGPTQVESYQRLNFGSTCGAP
jgi:integrase